MSENGQGDGFREALTPDERALTLRHTIDPGFVNHRLIETVVGQGGRRVLEELVGRVPPMAEWMRTNRVAHIYTDVALEWCRVNGAKTLGTLLAEHRGRIFCSTEPLAPCPDVYDVRRVVSRWLPRGDTEMDVAFHYSTRHLIADTIKDRLHQGAELSLIAVLHEARDRELVFHPLVIGNPWLHTEDERLQSRAMWWGWQYYENFIEDFAEFAAVRTVAKPSGPDGMRSVSEAAFKRALATILGDSSRPDWGGETSDYFSAHLHLAQQRVTGAFLLKGPAWFAPMTLNHLGKNNDQIYRLAHEPADVLFVQQCHEVTPPVRATLRAFAVQPSNPRRYCVIDGRDSLWLLQAHGLYEDALRWSVA